MNKKFYINKSLQYAYISLLTIGIFSINSCKTCNSNRSNFKSSKHPNHEPSTLNSSSTPPTQNVSDELKRENNNEIDSAKKNLDPKSDELKRENNNEIDSAKKNLDPKSDELKRENNNEIDSAKKNLDPKSDELKRDNNNEIDSAPTSLKHGAPESHGKKDSKHHDHRKSAIPNPDSRTIANENNKLKKLKCDLELEQLQQTDQLTSHQKLLGVQKETEDNISSIESVYKELNKIFISFSYHKLAELMVDSKKEKNNIVINKITTLRKKASSDKLIKEMKLNKICTKIQENEFFLRTIQQDLRKALNCNKLVLQYNTFGDIQKLLKLLNQALKDRKTKLGNLVVNDFYVFEIKALLLVTKLLYFQGIIITEKENYLHNKLKIKQLENKIEQSNTKIKQLQDSIKQLEQAR